MLYTASSVILLLSLGGYSKTYASYNDLLPRIVGGRPALEGEAPYQLSLRVQDPELLDAHHLCGATLVLSPSSQEQIAITASHCVFAPGQNEPFPAEFFSLRGGAIDWTGGQIRNAVKIISHEAYHDTVYNDITIILLDSPFELSETLQPMALPLDATDDKTEFLTVSGWGLTQLAPHGGSPESLQIVKVPVVSNAICAEWYGQHFPDKEVILETSLCGGLEMGGEGTCVGDSGGPAIGEDSEGLFLAGVVSWGGASSEGCAVARAPGVYTRVSQYIGWISEQTSREMGGEEGM